MKGLEILEVINKKIEEINVDGPKFYSGNKSAGTRVRKSAQELKSLLQELRVDVLDHKKILESDK